MFTAREDDTRLNLSEFTSKLSIFLSTFGELDSINVNADFYESELTVSFTLDLNN